MWMDRIVSGGGPRERHSLRQIGEGEIAQLQRGEGNSPPMVGSLFSWKSLFTKRSTSDDCIVRQSRLPR